MSFEDFDFKNYRLELSNANSHTLQDKVDTLKKGDTFWLLYFVNGKVKATPGNLLNSVKNICDRADKIDDGAGILIPLVAIYVKI
jgi:hypothetical protein